LTAKIKPRFLPALEPVLTGLKTAGFIRVFGYLGCIPYAAHTPRMNCDEMAGDRLTVCKQELL